MANFHVERALFVVGDQRACKSTQLRSMYRDVRFHRKGVIPRGKNVRKLPVLIRLSNERSLYVRLRSPHEADETLKQFLNKTQRRINRRRRRFGKRWSFVGPLQPQAANKMPNTPTAVAAFIRRFAPERARVVFLLPNQHGMSLDPTWLQRATDRLWRAGVEVICVDARSPAANGLVLADFFDFT